uniref:integrase core domain-containing protein n=1 Tax=uncultured Allisonella sp. TaxID=339338 RepID=UPI002598BFA7|nr:integrase core domain-containing protein [uncultured Allisonella sp.]
MLRYLLQFAVYFYLTVINSYSHKGYPYDNACIESFHSLIKRKWLNRITTQDYYQAYSLVFEYLETFYNTVRIHSHCDYMSPDDFEEQYSNLQKPTKQAI